MLEEHATPVETLDLRSTLLGPAPILALSRACRRSLHALRVGRCPRCEPRLLFADLANTSLPQLAELDAEVSAPRGTNQRFPRRPACPTRM